MTLFWITLSAAGTFFKKSSINLWNRGSLYVFFIFSSVNPNFLALRAICGATGLEPFMGAISSFSVLVPLLLFSFLFIFSVFFMFGMCCFSFSSVFIWVDSVISVFWVWDFWFSWGVVDWICSPTFDIVLFSWFLLSVTWRGWLSSLFPFGLIIESLMDGVSSFFISFSWNSPGGVVGVAFWMN